MCIFQINESIEVRLEILSIKAQIFINQKSINFLMKKKDIIEDFNE